jgi:hypothetical protein
LDSDFELDWTPRYAVHKRSYMPAMSRQLRPRC